MTKEQELARLQMQCSRSEYCTGQVREKLRRRSVGGCLEEVDVEWIINSLLADKFIDDSRFTAAYVRDKSRLNGWGRRKIEYQLRKLGVAGEVLETAIRENYGKEDAGADVLGNLVKRKWNSLKKEEAAATKRLKVLRFAAGRGFEYEDIMQALRRLE
ncbi:MAG: regulatory protein RecX [Bacteroidales bacterium]